MILHPLNRNYTSLLFKLLFFIVIFLSNTAIAQKGTKIFVKKTNTHTTLSKLINEIEQTKYIDVIFEDKNVLTKQLPPIKNPIELSTYLRALLPNKYIVVPSRKIILVLDSYVNINKLFVDLIPKNSNNFKAQVFDELTGKAIDGANVFFKKDKSGFITDSNGMFYKQSKKDLIVAEVSFIGYKKRTLILAKSNFAKNKTVIIPLETAFGMLQDVMVSAKRQNENIKIQKIGVQTIAISNIKEIPTFLGEIDPIKAITTMPGVSTNGDMGSGFSVRGGNSSQNLVLQDGGIIFNTSHLFGFFSAFNPDFIEEIELLKGGGTADYGGRVSSVLNIKTKNGNMNNFKALVGTGLISSRIALEGPIVKDKSSFLIGGRISYSNWFIRMFDDIKLKNSSAKYHDVTAKFTQRIGDKSIVTLSAYYSADSFNLALDSTFNWSTKNISLNWIQKHSKRAKSTITLANSNYSSGVDYSNEIFGFDYSNGINVVSFNYKFNYKLTPKINLLAGITNNYNIINPGESYPNTDISLSEAKKLNTQRSIESAIFIGGNIDINDKLSVNVGLRYDNYLRLGEDHIYTLDYNNLDGRTASITDTTYYGKSDIISRYGGFQPRISMRYMLTESASLKLGYSKMKQYIHQISSTTIPSPVDFWISSGPNLQPQTGNQISLGYFQNFNDSFLETSIEAFYKTTDNSIDYIAGVDLHLNDNIDAALTQGSAYSYGLEFLLKRTEGKLNGWLAYTFSRSYQIMEGESPELAINDGEKYPSIFDQPHQLTLVLNYRLSNLVVFSSNFTYNSGRPITIPISKFSYGHAMSVNNYSTRNAYRMPDYHRLDLSLTFFSKKKPNSKFSSEIIISVYNAYARKNAYAVYFDNYGFAYKTYILGTMLPSVSYILKFE